MRSALFNLHISDTCYADTCRHFLSPIALPAADKTLVKFGRADSDFPEFLAHRAEGKAAPLLRTIEGWLRAERDTKRGRGIKMTEDAERVVDELRGAAGNGYLSGRFNGGFNG